jgi:hypothetical protein
MAAERNIQSIPERKVNILGGHIICHSKQTTAYVRLSYTERFRLVELFHCTVHCTLYRLATRLVLTRVAKCIVVDGRIFENVLY